MADAYYDQTVLFLPFDTTAFPASNTKQAPYDYSKYRNAVTGNNLLDIPASPQVKYGNKAGYFNPSGSYDQSRHLSSTAAVANLAFSGDFTIEGWVYPLSVGASWGSFILDTRNSSGTAGSGFALYYGWSTISNKVAFSASGHADLVSDSPLTLNTWSHIAIVRSAGVLKMYINGITQASTIAYAGSYGASQCFMGNSANSANTTGIAGYLDEFRITTAARYTANFTPAQINLADYPIHNFSPKALGFINRKDTLFDRSSLSKITRSLSPSLINIPGGVKAGGNGSISGTVKVGTLAVKRKVRLYEANTGFFITEQWTGDDGSYLFSGVRTDIPYTVTSTDHTNQYNDVIAARVTAVV